MEREGERGRGLDIEDVNRLFPKLLQDLKGDKGSPWCGKTYVKSLENHMFLSESEHDWFPHIEFVRPPLHLTYEFLDF